MIFDEEEGNTCCKANSNTMLMKDANKQDNTYLVVEALLKILKMYSKGTMSMWVTFILNKRWGGNDVETINNLNY